MFWALVVGIIVVGAGIAMLSGARGSAPKTGGQMPDAPRKPDAEA